MECLEKKLEVTDQAAQICVQFYRCENRFGHAVTLLQDGKSFQLATIDQVDNDWPASPPIQDIHFEDRGHCQLLFGVGMAGKTHYSVSIESNLNDRLKFEFAAHIKEGCDFLGTSYECQDASPFSARMRPLEGSKLESSDTTDSQSKLIVEPLNVPRSDLPATIQWGFEIGRLEK